MPHRRCTRKSGLHRRAQVHVLIVGVRCQLRDLARMARTPAEPHRDHLHAVMGGIDLAELLEKHFGAGIEIAGGVRHVCADRNVTGFAMADDHLPATGEHDLFHARLARGLHDPIGADDVVRDEFVLEVVGIAGWRGARIDGIVRRRAEMHEAIDACNCGRKLVRLQQRSDKHLRWRQTGRWPDVDADDGVASRRNGHGSSSSDASSRAGHENTLDHDCSPLLTDRVQAVSIASAIFSADMSTGKFVFALGTIGKIEASTTRKPLMPPRTRP